MKSRQKLSKAITIHFGTKRSKFQSLSQLLAILFDFKYEIGMLRYVNQFHNNVSLRPKMTLSALLSLNSVILKVKKLIGSNLVGSISMVPPKIPTSMKPKNNEPKR